MKLSMILAVLLGGVVVSLQTAWNARMRVAVGNPVLSALLSVTVTFVLLTVIASSGLMGRGKLSGVSSAPWWAWGGGFAGAYFLVITLVALPRIGAALVVASLVLGQMAMALVLDATGWFGVPHIEPTPIRILGAALLVVGVVLLQRR